MRVPMFQSNLDKLAMSYTFLTSEHEDICHIMDYRNAHVTCHVRGDVKIPSL